MVTFESMVYWESSFKAKMSWRRKMKTEMLELIEKAEKHEEQHPHLLWNILTALRGCDNGDDNLKELTTSRVRGVVCPNLGVAGGAFIRTKPLSVNERKERDTKILESPNHFRNHYLSAVEAIEILYGINLITEEEIK